jgi:hypothetical protein
MDPEEHLLRHVFAPPRIADAAGHQGEHQPLVTLHQFAKRLLVALAAPLHELVL